MSFWQETWLIFIIIACRLNIKNKNKVVTDIHRLPLHQSPEIQEFFIQRRELHLIK